MMRNYIWLAAFILIAGCATQPAPGSPEQRMQEIEEKRAVDAEIVKVSVSQAPDWYDNPPRSGAALYAVGESRQRNLTLARRIATNNAKISLAERFGLHIDGFTESYLDLVGEDFKEGAKAAFSQKLVGFEVTKQEKNENNGMVQFFVLMEYPIGDANRLIVGELKKDEKAYLDARKDEGFRMMEEMLESRGAN